MKKLVIMLGLAIALFSPQPVSCDCHELHHKGEPCDCEKCAECIYCLPEITPYCDMDWVPNCG